MALPDLDLPHFPLHPNVYRLNLFAEQAGVCEVCEQPRHYQYTGVFYSQDEVDNICPWCVADGSAADKFAGSFNDAMGIEGTEFGEEDADGEVKVTWTLAEADITQLCKHTPAYSSWQQGQWLVCCAKPCAFIAYADSAMLAPIWSEIEADVLAHGIPVALVREHLRVDGDLAGYLFQCVDCGKHRLHLDCA